ncbi:hypothetical protein [Streptomyces sp. NPDC001492]
MVEAIQVAEEHLGQPITVFWIDGGLPETFSLPGLDPPVVVFSARHLEMLASLRGTLSADHLSEELGARVAERLNLRIVAELTLRHGDVATACYLFLESALNEGFFAPLVTLADLEARPVDELYMAFWFYGLLHECGHVVLAHDRGSSTDWREINLADLIERVIDESFGDEAATARESIRAAGTTRSLDLQVLMEEVRADVLGVRLLFAAAFRVLGRADAITNETAGRLAVEVVTMFGLFHYMNGCAQIARDASQEFEGGLDKDLGFNVANAVRLNVVADALADDLAAAVLASGDDGEEAEETYERIRTWILDVVSEAIERQAAFDRGHHQAMRLVLYANERRADVYRRLAEHLLANDARALYFQNEARAFLALASDLGVQHPDLDLLAAIAGAPRDTHRLVSEHAITFRLAWVMGDGVDLPLCVPLSDGRLIVFVFLTDAVDRYVERARISARPGWAVGRAAIVAPTEHEARISIHRLVDLDARDLTVVFEGSEAFEFLSRSIFQHEGGDAVGQAT